MTHPILNLTHYIEDYVQDAEQFFFGGSKQEYHSIESILEGFPPGLKPLSTQKTHTLLDGFRVNCTPHFLCYQSSMLSSPAPSSVLSESLSLSFSFW